MHTHPIDSGRTGARVQLVARYFVAREERCTYIGLWDVIRIGRHGTESHVYGDVQPFAYVQSLNTTRNCALRVAVNRLNPPNPVFNVVPHQRKGINEVETEERRRPKK